MKIRKSILMDILIYGGSIFILLAIVGFFMMKGTPPQNVEQLKASAVKMDGDVQVVTLKVKGGYWPQNVEAKAGVKTVLVLETQNTFDCSAAVVIPALNVNEILPTNGKREIPLNVQSAGSQIQGSCSMGMYGFTIRFI
jgi:plastocyanin domain-containing protein